MQDYSHIIVGLDLSEECRDVLTKAAAVAAKYRAKVSVVHVVEPLAFSYGGDIPIDLYEAQASLESQAKSRLAKLTKELGVTVEHHIVMVGQTASEIHRLAREQQCDLIVVGSHARHGLALLLGSTANGVLHGAECDVLAIRV